MNEITSITQKKKKPSKKETQFIVTNSYKGTTSLFDILKRLIISEMDQETRSAG